MNSDERARRFDCALCADDGSLRALAQAANEDDLDAALALGLLDYRAWAEREIYDLTPVCETCRMLEGAVVLARDARLRALAARERFRAREARLQRRADERARRREAGARAASAAHAADARPAAAAALPQAAAAALARAKAKAAARNAKE